ncbi:MAG: hypothetical protein PVH61_37975 [Candidatus Aminicenantes bacterium]|jgi:mRNA-degrading endonuclease RelE of RelBE toxin-antitoxin system
MTSSGEVPVYKLVYAKSVKKDIRHIAAAQLEMIKFDVDTVNKTIYILQIGHRRDIY